MSSKSLVSCLSLSETNIVRNLQKTKHFGHPPQKKNCHKFIYIAPSGDHSLLTVILPFYVVLGKFEVVSDVWCEKDALLNILMELHTNQPIQYYGFKSK